MSCQYLKIRSKNYSKYYYCSILKSSIELNKCNACKYKSYKVKRSINRVSKARVAVTKDTYNSVYLRDEGRCQLCGKYDNTYDIKEDIFTVLQLHHILYRSESKDLINDTSNCIMLCAGCHRLVHSNKKKYQPILLDIRAKRGVI